MATATPVWAYPGGYVTLEIDNRDRITNATVHVPDGYIGRVNLVTSAGRSYSRDFPAGDTDVPINPAVAQDSETRIGMECVALA